MILLKIEHLKYFVEVVQCASMNKAAKNLFVTQPTLTSTIKALENELGFSLIIRSNKGVSLTKNGEKVYSDALKILGMVQQWQTMQKEKQMCAGDVHIAAIPSISPMVTQCASLLKKTAPDINIIIHDGRKHNLMTLLKQQTISIGILGYLNEEREDIIKFVNQTNFIMEDLFTDQFCIYVSPSHPLAKKSSLMQKDLNGFPIAIYAGEDPVAPFFLKYFEPSECYYVDNLNSMMNMAVNNNVIAICTSSYAYQNPLVENKILKLLSVTGFVLPFHYCLLYPSSALNTAAEKMVIENLRTIQKEYIKTGIE